MIQFTKSFQASDGNIFGTLELAQEHELILILKESDRTLLDDQAWIRIAKYMIANSGKIADILTTKASSRPRARAVHGGRKPRKGKEQPLLAV